MLSALDTFQARFGFARHSLSFPDAQVIRFGASVAERQTCWRPAVPHLKTVHGGGVRFLQLPSAIVDCRADGCSGEPAADPAGGPKEPVSPLNFPNHDRRFMANSPPAGALGSPGSFLFVSDRGTFSVTSHAGQPRKIAHFPNGNPACLATIEGKPPFGGCLPDLVAPLAAETAGESVSMTSNGGGDNRPDHRVARGGATQVLDEGQSCLP